MSVILNGHNLIGLKLRNKTAVFQDKRWGENDWSSASMFKPALVELGYGFLDGVIKGPTRVAADNSSAYYTANCTSYSAVTGQLSGNGNYCLTQDTTLNLSTFVEDTEFSGILDGCGHTLTINCYKDNYDANSSHAWGALIGTLTGTIKNIRIITKFYWKCTKSNGYAQYVGGVCGRVNGGTLENVFVEVGYYTGTDYNMDYSGRPTSNAIKMAGGIAGDATGTVNWTNVTVQIDNMGWRNTDGGSWTGRPDVKAGLAGFIAHISSGATVTLKNVSVSGSGALDSWCQNGGDGGGVKLHKGGFVGYSEGMLSIINSKNSWSGGSTHGGGEKGNYECSMVGAASNANNLTIEVLYYTASSYAATNGYLEYQDTQTALFGQLYYESMENYIGFKDDELWIGDIMELELRSLTDEHDIKGKYQDSITIGSGPWNFGNIIAKLGFNHYVITRSPVDKFQSMTDAIKSIGYGYYGYLTNEPGPNVTTPQGQERETYKVYYNNGQTANWIKSEAIITKTHVGIYQAYFRWVPASQVNPGNNDIVYTYYNTSSGYYGN